jgi:hypothetical protein
VPRFERVGELEVGAQYLHTGGHEGVSSASFRGPAVGFETNSRTVKRSLFQFRV